MRSSKVSFINKEGVEITARLDLPADQHPRAYALFAHCFTCSKDLSAVRNISRALTSGGIGLLRFDFTGLGQSSGEFADTGFQTNISDLLAAAEYMRQNFAAPALMIGHSLGGTATLIAAASIIEVAAVVTIGSPFDPAHVTHLFDANKAQLEQNGRAEVNIGGRPFTVKKLFLDQLAGIDMASHLRELRKPLLVMHAPFDKIVGIENAGEIFQAALHPKSYVSLDQADHLLSRPEDAMQAGSIIAAWADKYLPKQADASLDTTEQVVSLTAANSYTTEIRAGKHGLVADEPLALGGNDFGPNPYELLLSSLAACTGMTLRMYANRKKWPLEDVRIHLRHEKIHAKDCEQCETETGKIDKIYKQIELEGPLDEAQRTRLMEIADRCPVHRTIQGEIVIESIEKEITPP